MNDTVKGKTCRGTQGLTPLGKVEGKGVKWLLKIRSMANGGAAIKLSNLKASYQVNTK